MKTLFTLALSAACLLAADTNIVLTPLNKDRTWTVTDSKIKFDLDEKLSWQIGTNVAELTIRTNRMTNWVALQMAKPNLPQKYIGVLQTNRVMRIVYKGQTNELMLDNLWTEDVIMKQDPATTVRK